MGANEFRNEIVAGRVAPGRVELDEEDINVMMRAEEAIQPLVRQVESCIRDRRAQGELPYDRVVKITHQRGDPNFQHEAFTTYLFEPVISRSKNIPSSVCRVMMAL